MEDQEKIIHKIVNDLHQLPVPYLENIYQVVHLLRTKLSDTASEEVPQPKNLPFVDEIDKVREQSRNVQGRQEDQYLS